MDVQLIVNPGAASMSPKHQLAVHRALSEVHQVSMVETEYRGHATELAAKAAAGGTELIVVLSGDGTLNEVANGLIGTECLLAPLPGGSTNVFCRTLGLDDNPQVAVQTTLAAIEARSFTRVGTGSVNGRHFLFHAGIGWDARVVQQVEKRSHLKRRLGHGLFIWAGLETWFRLYDRTAPHYSIDYGDGTGVEGAYFTIVQNTNPYTFIGKRPFNISPDATLHGPLTAATLKVMQAKPFLALMKASLTEPNALLTSPIVDYRSPVGSMTISANPPVPLQVDGDDLGDHGHIAVDHHPDSLRLVVPTGFEQ